MTRARKEESSHELMLRSAREAKVKELAQLVLPGVVSAMGHEVVFWSNQNDAVDHAFRIAERFMEVATERMGSIK